jgi:hypothetical protein
MRQSVVAIQTGDESILNLSFLKNSWKRMEVTIPLEEKERLYALGSAGIMREMADNKHCQPTSPYRDAVDSILASVKASEDAAAFARAEDREERMLAISERNVAISENALSIAKDDLAAARQQATWAKWSAVVAVVALVISRVDEISKLWP